MLNTKLGKVGLRTPLVLASGILGTDAKIMQRCIDNGAGAVTLKSIGPIERLGHNNPVVLDYGAGIINAVGLPTPGYKNMDGEWDEINRIIKEPVIASVYGGTVEEYIDVIKYISKFNPDIIELNVSCPNKENGMAFGKDPDSVSRLIKEAKKATKIPIMPKLTPNCNDIKEIAIACEKAGADMIAAINTVGPGMVIDIDARMPILNFKTGGLSGPAIKPVAIRCVYDIYESVSLPILGIGGVSEARDAIEMMMAGASAVGIGSAVYYDGIDVFSMINKGIENWMKHNKVNDLKQIVGAAHR